jgi:hypothetical protein
VVASSPDGDLAPGTYPSSSHSIDNLELRNLSSSTTADQLTISLPSTPLVFSEKYYPHPIPLSSQDWTSAYLPDGWYGLVAPGQAVWGSIPNKKELALPSKVKGFKEVAYGM